MGKSEIKDNYGKPRSVYLSKLADMDDDKLFDEAKDRIWLSAYASNNPRSDYHWQCDACYDESIKRGKPQIYSNAYKSITED